MAGYREFQTGEVLTAANVNEYLMEQSVMAFADAAARDTALGTAVAGGNALREGMLAYLNDTDALLKYDGTSWATVGNAGIGSNVVQTVKTDTFSASVAPGGTSTAAITASITPTSASSLILVFAQISATHSASSRTASGTLFRDGSALTGATGDADASRRRTTMATGADSTRQANSGVTFYLDSPATTSSVTYDVRLGHDSTSTQTLYLNRGAVDDNSNATTRNISSLTLIEVAA